METDTETEVGSDAETEVGSDTSSLSGHEACLNSECLALFTLTENLSLDVKELSARCERLRVEAQLLRAAVRQGRRSHSLNFAHRPFTECTPAKLGTAASGSAASSCELCPNPRRPAPKADEAPPDGRLASLNLPLILRSHSASSLTSTIQVREATPRPPASQRCPRRTTTPAAAPAAAANGRTAANNIRSSSHRPSGRVTSRKTTPTRK
jgi:hypothetical protein